MREPKDEQALVRLELKKEKLLELSLFARSISHEINNHLAIIQGRANQLSKIVSNESLEAEREKIKSCTDSILNTTHRMKKMIADIRTYGVPGEEEVATPVAIFTLIESVAGRLRIEFPRVKVELNLSFPRDLHYPINPETFKTALYYVCQNGCEASLAQTVPWLKIEGELQDDKLCLRVIDAGHGVSSETQAKMFTLFFTTKDSLQESGCGLSFAKQMIERNNGQLYFDKHALNTTFVIELPM